MIIIYTKGVILNNKKHLSIINKAVQNELIKYKDSVLLCNPYFLNPFIFLDGYISPKYIIDTIIETDYESNYICSLSFDFGFITELMANGFFVKTIRLALTSNEIFTDTKGEINEILNTFNTKYNRKEELKYVCNYFSFNFDKIRQIINLNKPIYIGKTNRRLIKKYELCIDKDLDIILENCVKYHGSAWITPMFIELIRNINKLNYNIRIKTFGIYQNGELKAGEFGVVSGKIYTSYSGYYEKSSAGNIQMIMMLQYLQDNGFTYCDMGGTVKIYEYKYKLGAENMTRKEYAEIYSSNQ